MPAAPEAGSISSREQWTTSADGSRWAPRSRLRTGTVAAAMRLVCIGNGMVGQRFLEKLVAAPGERYEITVLCEEPRAAYDRVQSMMDSGKAAMTCARVIHTGGCAAPPPPAVPCAA